jgi:uncharacterized membrane protein
MIAWSVFNGMKPLLQALDWRTVLLAHHAMHVVLIHFPIALFLAGVLFDALAHWQRRPALAAAAHLNLLGAALTVIPAFVTGLIAWRWALDGARLKGLLLFHLIFGTLSAALIVLVAWFHHRAREAAQPLPRYRFPLEFGAAVIVAVTAHLGGFLSGVNGG